MFAWRNYVSSPVATVAAASASNVTATAAAPFDTRAIVVSCAPWEYRHFATGGSVATLITAKDGSELTAEDLKSASISKNGGESGSLLSLSMFGPDADSNATELDDLDTGSTIVLVNAQYRRTPATLASVPVVVTALGNVKGEGAQEVEPIDVEKMAFDVFAGQDATLTLDDSTFSGTLTIDCKRAFDDAALFLDMSANILAGDEGVCPLVADVRIDNEPIGKFRGDGRAPLSVFSRNSKLGWCNIGPLARNAQVTVDVQLSGGAAFATAGSEALIYASVAGMMKK